MGSKDIIRRNKKRLQNILQKHVQHVLDCAFQNELLQELDYTDIQTKNNLKPSEAIIDLVDKIMFKDEKTCTSFLGLLQNAPLTDCVPVLKTRRERMDQLEGCIDSLRGKMKERESIQTKYNEVVEHNKKQVQATEKQISAVFRMLRLFLEAEEAARLKALKEEDEKKKKTASRHLKDIEDQMEMIQDQISSLEQQMEKLRSSFDDALQSQTSDIVVPEPKPLSTKALIDMAKHVRNLTFEVCQEMEKEKVKFTPVTLDPNTAHRSLRLSEDLTSVRRTSTSRRLPDNPERFTHDPDVLGSEAFSSGLHRWEVGVGDHPDWITGVVKESVDRKCPGRDTEVTPKDGFWYLGLRNDMYYTGCYQIKLEESPQRIIVQLDYDGGEVSFYDPDNETHIYRHKATFTEPLYPYLSIGTADIDIKVCQVEPSVCKQLDLWEDYGSSVKKKGTCRSIKPRAGSKSEK